MRSSKEVSLSPRITGTIGADWGVWVGVWSFTWVHLSYSKSLPMPSKEESTPVFLSIPFTAHQWNYGTCTDQELLDKRTTPECNPRLFRWEKGGCICRANCTTHSDVHCKRQESSFLLACRTTGCKEHYTTAIRDLFEQVVQHKNKQPPCMFLQVTEGSLHKMRLTVPQHYYSQSRSEWSLDFWNYREACLDVLLWP